MKKNRYITPEIEVVELHLISTVMAGLDDLFGGASEKGEDNQSPWAGAKEQDFTDDTDDIWGMETKDVWER